MTNRHIDALFVDEVTAAMDERNARLDNAEAAHDQADREIDDAHRVFNAFYRDAVRRRREDLAALNKVTP